MKKNKAREVDIETSMLANRIVAEIAREAFIRNVSIGQLAEMAQVKPNTLLALMLDPENLQMGTIARLSAALGIRYSMQMVPRESAK